MFHSCRYPSENPTASWLVLGTYCSAVTPTPLGPFSWRQRCLPCLVLTSLSLGISPGDLVTICRSGQKKKYKNRDIKMCTCKCSNGTCAGFFIYRAQTKSDTSWPPHRWGIFRFLIDDTFIFPAVNKRLNMKLLIKAHITVTHCGKNRWNNFQESNGAGEKAVIISGIKRISNPEHNWEDYTPLHYI